jgi:hypothetical protein
MIAVTKEDGLFTMRCAPAKSYTKFKCENYSYRIVMKDFYSTHITASNILKITNINN